MGSREGPWALVLAFALLAFPIAALAQGEAEAATDEEATSDVRVTEGIRLYESAELPEAKAVLARALAEGELSPSEANRARRYLAASLLAGGDLAGARAALVELFQADAKAEVSPEIFVPALVTLAEEAKREVDADHAAAGDTPPPVKDPPVTIPDPEEVKEPPVEDPVGPPAPKTRGLSLRAGIFGLSELTGSSVGAGASVTVGWRGIELSPRLLLGKHLGGELELAYAFATGSVQPRLGMRATFVPDAGWGAGQFVGLRAQITGGLELTADAGVAFFDAGSDFRTFGILLNLGVAYRVMGR